MFKKRGDTAGSKRKRPILDDHDGQDNIDDLQEDLTIPSKRQKKGLPASELMKPSQP